MPANTVNRGYPYPLPTDPADVPAALQSLAEAVDADVCDLLQVPGRQVAQFRGTGTFASPSPSQPLSPPPTDHFYRVPFTVEEFDTIGVEMQSQEIGNRLIFPTVPGFYFALATVQVPVLTIGGATVTYMGLQIRKGDATNPLSLATRLNGASHNVPVDSNDRNVRIMSAGAGAFMNGTSDAFTVEWRADTTPNVSEYVINERVLTIIRMTQS